MSDNIQRWRFYRDGMAHHTEGGWVEYRRHVEELERLRVENARLAEQIANQTNNLDYLNREFVRVERERDALQRRLDEARYLLIRAQDYALSQALEKHIKYWLAQLPTQEQPTTEEKQG